LAHHFRASGYATGYIGKWHLSGKNAPGAVHSSRRGGYEDWLGANVLELVSDAYDCRLYDNEDREVCLPGYRVDAVTDAAIRHVHRRSQEDRPFFLFLSFLEPHQQNSRDDYPAPDGYAERYTGRWMPPDLAALDGSADSQVAGYCGMVKRLDEALGRLRDALKSLNLLDDTIIAFTSDHGCHFKTRNQEYKRTCHEASIRIPMVLSGPGFAGRGSVDELVSLIDLPPTLLDAAGLPVPESMDGHSILPLLDGDPTGQQEEIFIQTSEHELGRSIRTTQWKYGVLAPEIDGSVHSCAETYHESFLYDLSTDPSELNNLVRENDLAHVTADLRRRLLQRIIEAGEDEPEILPAKATYDEREVTHP
jgi:arylsulfatase A-like enzyme